MSILKVNDIRRATTGSSALVISDPIIITTGSISASVLIGSLPGTVTIGDGTIGKEKLTNDARDWVNILNKPAGILSSSAQLPPAISGASVSFSTVSASGVIFTSGSFSGSGVGLSNIPNSALVNNTITINGTAVTLGSSRTLTTADISESSNLYYTDTRVKSKLNTDSVVSSSGQINYQSITGQPSVNTLGSDGNKSFTITAGVFITGSTGIDVSTDAPNAKITLKTTGGTVSSSAQVAANLPSNTVSSSNQVKVFLPDGIVSASSQYPGWVTASSQVVWSQVNYNSGVVSSSTQVKPLLPADTVTSSAQVKTFLPIGTISASTQYPGWITSSTQVVESLPNGTVSASSQYPGWVTASGQIDVRNTIGITTIATTGSNVFVGNQIMSGSVTVTGNLNILGSSSIVYTSASELVVGDNKIVVNSTDALRFAGLQIIDSGSTSPTTASFYWDGLNHKFIYENLSGSDYNSAIFLAGPKHTGVLGNEPVLTTGRVPVATGEDHLDNRAPSSSIRVDFNTLRTDIEAGLYITGSTTASGHIVPSMTDTYDLGSPELKFKDLYLSGSTLYLGSLAIRDSGGALSIGPSGSVVGTNSPISGAFTGSFKGNGNQLTNISNAALPGGIISSSAQLPAGTVSSSAQYPGWVTSSVQIDYNSITNKLSGVYSSSVQIANNLPIGTVSSSNQVTAIATTGFTAGVQQVMSDNNVHSGSYLGTATTNNLSEGFTNLYYTDARVKTKLNADAVHSGSWLGTATTTNLTEGTNLYFTDVRVISALPINTVSSSNQVTTFLPAGTVSSSTQVNLSQAFNTASQALTASYALTSLGTTATNTDGLPEGTTNLYYTDARVKTKLGVDNVHSGSFLGTATTTNLTEGINLYFTNTRVVNALPIGVVSSSAQYPGWVTASSQIDYNSITNKLSGVVSSSTQVQPLLPNGTVSASEQTITNVAGQYITPSGSNFQGIVSGSGNQYRLVVPVGTNYYAI